MGHTWYMAYVDVNLLAENVNSTNKTTEVLLDTSKDLCVQVTAKKTSVHGYVS
jgi:hypothetical protein